MSEFDAKQQLAGLLDWMRAQIKACGGKTAVIGISGGKDSSVVAALSVAAYGRENVVGVLMPDGVQPDIDYSNGLVEHLGIRQLYLQYSGRYEGPSRRDGPPWNRGEPPDEGEPALPHPHDDALRHRAERGLRHCDQHLQSLRGLGGLLHDLRRQRGRFLAAGHVHDRGGHRAGRGAGASRALPHQAAVRRPDRQDRRGQPRLHLSCGERICPPAAWSTPPSRSRSTASTKFRASSSRRCRSIRTACPSFFPRKRITTIPIRNEKKQKALAARRGLFAVLCVYF